MASKSRESRDVARWGQGRTDLPARRQDYEWPYSALRDRMNRMLEDFFQGSWMQPWSAFEGETDAFAPRFSFEEDANEYKLTGELPGMDEKDIDVNLSNDVLTIRGTKQQEQKDDREGYSSVRRSYGSFHRSFTVPEGIDHDHIRADMHKGLLRVTLPKTEEAKKASRRIEVHGKG